MSNQRRSDRRAAMASVNNEVEYHQKGSPPNSVISTRRGRPPSPVPPSSSREYPYIQQPSPWPSATAPSASNGGLGKGPPSAPRLPAAVLRQQQRPEDEETSSLWSNDRHIDGQRDDISEPLNSLLRRSRNRGVYHPDQQAIRIVTRQSPRYSDVLKVNPKYEYKPALSTVPPSPYFHAETDTVDIDLDDKKGKGNPESSNNSYLETPPRNSHQRLRPDSLTPTRTPALRPDTLTPTRTPALSPAPYPTPPSSGSKLGRSNSARPSRYDAIGSIVHKIPSKVTQNRGNRDPFSVDPITDSVLVHEDGDIVIPPSSPSQSVSGVLYRLICLDGEKQTFRYSWNPFKGLQRDDREIQERRDLAVLDIVDMVEGDHLTEPPRKSQFRHSFWQDDPAEFNLEVDFRVRRIHPTGLRIHSLYVQSVLRALIRYYPGFDVQEREISFIYPFKELFHYWNDLQRIIGEGKNGNAEVIIKNPDTGSDVIIKCDDLTCEHLLILTNAPPVKDAFEKVVKPELQLYDEGLASYDFLWLLFKPGEIVFTQIRGKIAGFVVMKITHISRNESESPLFNPHPADRWELSLWNLAYDNKRLRRQSHNVSINRFYGEKSISDLPAFPTKFSRNPGALRDELIERGKRYHAIICDEQSHMRYNGFVIAEKPYHYQGEIIVDHQSYKLEASNYSSNVEIPDISGEEPEDLRGEPLFSKFNDMECSADNELEPAQYLLLPTYVLGFAIGKREWAIFDMSFVEDLETDGEDPMSYLIIDPMKRHLVEAVAGCPREGTALKPWDTDWAADFIEGKGRGRVVFLHGPPGTGKTMTVECIAKKTRRPLVRLSAADLGTEEGQMEKRLMRWLDRATIWGAIVLIDEAEVYLEQRQSGQISRNALVTAFLRTMEYFPGLLFLTSNGIGLFDEAVMSRIHLAVRYDRPTDEQRKQIWRSLFDKLEEDRRLARQRVHTASVITGRQGEEVKPEIIIPETTRDIALSKNEYAVNFQLNGRDIRNILLSAISLARYESIGNSGSGKRPAVIKVTAEQLERVLKNKEDFNNDYKHTTGFYPDQMAAEKFMRAESR
ncbi:hypothetical protein M434DRAFT_141672 [Hypoxylon sp. CO27-5]|nr:hypothetical protein M434DRAFT_141672 [Hypoxylon sp. CO27-5]